MAAYTFRAAGTVAQNADSSALSPGAPAGKTAGDLLVLVTGNYTAGQVFTTPSGWYRPLFYNTSSGAIACCLRIADGSATDTPTIDWDGTTDSYAYIIAYNGNVYLGTIFEGIVIGGEATDFGAAATLPQGTLVVPRDNSLVILASHKRKTATSNDATTVTAPAGTTLRAQLVQTGTAVAAGYADVQQTTKADYGGADFTINGTAESLVGMGLILVLRPEDGVYSTIVRDVSTGDLRTLTTSPQTFTHAGKASQVKGVVLSIVHGTSSTDHVSAASYGGVAMTRQKRNVDTVTEPGAAEIWFLGASVPQGSQTVSYTPGATTDDIYAVCTTLLGVGDLEVIDTDGVDNDVANPSVTLQAGGREIMCFGALYAGGANVSDFQFNANSQKILDNDFGAFYTRIFDQAFSAVGDFTLGGTSVSDDVAFAAIAVSPVVTTVNMIPGVTQAPLQQYRKAA